MLEKAYLNPVLTSRIASANDLIAAEGKYHLKCYAKFQRTAQQNLQERDKGSC